MDSQFSLPCAIEYQTFHGALFMTFQRAALFAPYNLKNISNSRQDTVAKGRKQAREFRVACSLARQTAEISAELISVAY